MLLTEDLGSRYRRLRPHIAMVVLGAIAWRIITMVPHGVGGRFLHWHAADLDAGIVLPAICAVIADPDAPAGRFVRSFRGKMIVVAFAAFVWEVVVPAIRPDSVGDPVDALCYVAGTLVQHVTRMNLRRIPILKTLEPRPA